MTEDNKTNDRLVYLWLPGVQSGKQHQSFHFFPSFSFSNLLTISLFFYSPVSARHFSLFSFLFHDIYIIVWWENLI
jgi:hypothetical protein